VNKIFSAIVSALSNLKDIDARAANCYTFFKDDQNCGIIAFLLDLMKPVMKVLYVGQEKTTSFAVLHACLEEAIKDIQDNFIHNVKLKDGHLQEFLTETSSSGTYQTIFITFMPDDEEVLFDLCKETATQMVEELRSRFQKENAHNFEAFEINRLKLHLTSTNVQAYCISDIDTFLDHYYQHPSLNLSIHAIMIVSYSKIRAS